MEKNVVKNEYENTVTSKWHSNPQKKPIYGTKLTKKY